MLFSHEEFERKFKETSDYIDSCHKRSGFGPKYDPDFLAFKQQQGLEFSDSFEETSAYIDWCHKKSGFGNDPELNQQESFGSFREIQEVAGYLVIE